jgi:uncharacterized protein YbjT (DUF2867 family)
MEMILITGGTGFIGQVLIQQLVATGRPVRILLRPSKNSPNLPLGVPVEVAVSSLSDERGLRAAMKGVDVVYHLAGVERKGSHANLEGVDIEGTRMVSNAARQAGVDRFFYLSHLGADRYSAYPVFKAKAIAENIIIHSGVNYTILRSAAVFGPGDQFTTALAQLLVISPWIFLVPGDGNTQIQPLWVDDLVACMVSALDEPETCNQLISLGGPEYLSFREIVEGMEGILNVRKTLIPISPAYLRILALFIETFFQQFPVSIFWVDYLAADRTCSLDTLPRQFGIMPARFFQHLDYLKLQTQTKTRGTR